MSSLYVHSLGICTSEFRSIDALAAQLTGPGKRAAFGTAPSKPAGGDGKEFAGAMLESLDPINRMAFPAMNQAWRAAHLAEQAVPTERIGLIFYSAWGQVDATTAYLQSMWAEEGRYASPRQFTRSVHSSPASLAAIEFNIHGPCQTLVHDAWPVCSVLEQAADLLQAGHADVMVVCWADQASALVAELYQRAVRELHHTELARFCAVDIHGGAVAAVVSRNEILAPRPLAVKVGPVFQNHDRAPPKPVAEHGAYPSDGAFHWAAAGLAWALAHRRNTAAEGLSVGVADKWGEIGHHRQKREISFGQESCA